MYTKTTHVNVSSTVKHYLHLLSKVNCNNIRSTLKIKLFLESNERTNKNNMAKNCGRCNKVVYPAEELKCLDKTWHKMCFKCTECGMQLTLKNYKGFNKLPYCNAHSPQLKATTVAETPEQKRLKQISDMNSQVLYQKDYKSNLGNVTSIADDPTTQRVKQLGNLSNVKYADNRNEEQEGHGYGEEVPYHQGGEGGEGGDEGLCYRAMFDYDATDSDEVSIAENDKIINCEVIDEGWIMGTVERTGSRGMIPANYVEAM
ncbi:hypothetical protein HELRODRAFT_179618 [Helobdella robusta]|uniref:LIM and SH3 domain protein 1 n=1 Tax=Helobdella robusta TaxID=6412 RepID=T1FEY0_HELRO|nr:hypothetical protein HELRODRAFT_179618 [Helobdella robusta]ESN95275.1 hypothetical protein HELRODRAFT_179618 [Helobdella robusta]